MFKIRLSQTLSFDLWIYPIFRPLLLSVHRSLHLVLAFVMFANSIRKLCCMCMHLYELYNASCVCISFCMYLCVPDFSAATCFSCKDFGSWRLISGVEMYFALFCCAPYLKKQGNYGTSVVKHSVSNIF